jgi:cytochrome c
MSEQPKLKPQHASPLFADGSGMRRPVEGSVPRGFLPYPYHGKPEEAGRMLRNPLAVTRPVLERGKQFFGITCSPCHGNFGRGDSRLRGQFPNPPTLHSEKVLSWSDGSIFHVITDGQNIMPSYAVQISPDDRWAIVHYVRVLQRAQNAKESDLK